MAGVSLRTASARPGTTAAAGAAKTARYPRRRDRGDGIMASGPHGGDADLARDRTARATVTA